VNGTHAVVVDAPGRALLAPHTPAVPGPGEALVRVHAVGVCGSDREVFHGTRPEGFVQYPLTPGHEWSGTVEAVGNGVPGHVVGRKVVGEGFRNCQMCDRCHRGETTLCAAGYDETGFTRPGAMAPTLTLPARLLHLLPDDADLTAAALLEPAACAAAAALQAGVRPGDRVAVVGTGALGLLAVQLLAATSPAELTVLGIHAARSDLARTFGATTYRCAGQDDSITRSTGAFDVVVEAAGAAGSAAGAAAMVRRGGRLVLAGIPAAGAVGLDPTDLVVRNLDVRTVFGATSAAWAHAVHAFAAGIMDPLPLVTHRLTLAQFENAVALAEGTDPAAAKVLLFPHPDDAV